MVTGLAVQIAAEKAAQPFVPGTYVSATCPLPWAGSANGQTVTCSFKATPITGGRYRDGSVTVIVSPTGEITTNVTVNPPAVYAVTVQIELEKQLRLRYPGSTAMISSCAGGLDDATVLNGKSVACSWTAYPSDGIYTGTAEGTISTQGEISIVPSAGTWAPYAPSSGCWIPGYYVPGFYVGGVWVSGYSVPGFSYC